MWFEVELKRESYVVLTVEADNPAEAEEKAWRELEQGQGDFGGNAMWSVEHVGVRE